MIDIVSLLSALLYPLILAETNWRIRQWDHRPLDLDLSDQVFFCRQTNMSHIEILLVPLIFGPRVVGSPAHKKVAMYLKRTLEALDFAVELDRFDDDTPLGRMTFRNVIATYDPGVPRRLTLACHYDSKRMPGQATSLYSITPIDVFNRSYFRIQFIGATDSALPCALLLDLATTLGPLLARRNAQDVGLQLIFFDGEEAFQQWTATDSLYGARHLAQRWSKTWFPSIDQTGFRLDKELDRIDVFILLDLLGAEAPVVRNIDGLGAEDLFPRLPRIESTLKQAHCLKPIPPIFDDLRSFNRIEDDHVPFRQHGVRVLHLISVPFPSVWHTQFDNSHALHSDTIYNLASILRVFVAEYLGLTT